MTPQYNNEQLIENIKRRCSVPTSQLTFTEEDFAVFATDELQSVVTPLIMSAREEYFVDFTDVTSNSTGEIEIPDYASGAKLRSVCFVQQTSPLILTNLPRIDLDVVAGLGFNNYQTLAGFYIQGNKLMLYPATSVPSGKTIRLYYYKRPLALAEPSRYGRVLSVDPLTNTVVLPFTPNDWEAGTQLNSVAANSPFNVTAEFEIVTISSPSIVLSSVDGISVGDYISDLGYSAIPQIPVEAHALLAQLVAVKALESLGDVKGMEVAQVKADKLQKSLMVLISQRVDGSTKKVINPNGGLRTISNYRRGYGRF